MHDGHPIEPVIVAGLSHSEDARTIPQQRTSQPGGDIPWMTINTEKKKAIYLQQYVTEPSEKLLLPFTSALHASGLSSAFLVKFAAILAGGAVTMNAPRGAV